MLIGCIPGTTRVLGRQQGYFGLPLRDIVINCTVGGPDTPAMETAWLPLPDELERLNAGAPVILRLLGTAHPPVMIEVGQVADATDPGLLIVGGPKNGARARREPGTNHLRVHVPLAETLREGFEKVVQGGEATSSPLPFFVYNLVPLTFAGEPLGEVWAPEGWGFDRILQELLRGAGAGGIRAMIEAYGRDGPQGGPRS